MDEYESLQSDLARLEADKEQYLREYQSSRQNILAQLKDLQSQSEFENDLNHMILLQDKYRSQAALPVNIAKVSGWVDPNRGKIVPARLDNVRIDGEVSTKLDGRLLVEIRILKSRRNTIIQKGTQTFNDWQAASVGVQALAFKALSLALRKESQK